jgi:hypothetical protein
MLLLVTNYLFFSCIVQIVHMECFLCSKLEEKNRLNLDIVQTLFKLKLLAFTHMSMNLNVLVRALS